MTTPDPSLAWRERAACRSANPELFFPIGSTGAALAEIGQAKAVCASCPVRRPCLTYALTAGEQYGIWGGRDETERRLLHHQWQEARRADQERLAVGRPLSPAAASPAPAVSQAG